VAFSKFDAARLYKKLRALEPNTPGVLGVPPSGVGAGLAGTVVLATGAGTTTDVTDARITSTTFMALQPVDTYAAAEVGAGNIKWSSPADGTMRITHTASTKTRTFKYLLMFSLALLWLASSAFGQVIEDDGVALEVRPALNFTTGITCTNAANSTDCANELDPADAYMKEGDWAIGATYGFGYPYVDFAEVAQAAIWIDTDGDGDPEITCDMGFNTCSFDANEDGLNDFSVSSGGTNSVTFFAGLSTQVTYTTAGIPMMQGTGFGNRFSETMGLGRSAFWGVSSASQGNSSCLGRNNDVDLLHTDPDCDTVTTGGPEAAYGSTTNSEAFLTDMQRRLSSDATSSSTTGAAITGLKLDLDWIGAYRIEYQILDQCNGSTGTGLAFGVEYTGTETSLYCRREFVSDGTTAATGTIDDVANTNAGQLVEGFAASAASTTAPNLGPNAGCTTTNTNLERIECNLVTSTAGDLTFYLASETGGTQVTVKANSTVRATPFP
jgi:hypothetical protein